MSTAEVIAGEIRQRILEGGYSDNELPNQTRLAVEFDVSLPSLRDALRILEAEGLIAVRRGKVGGAVILRPNAATAGYALGLALQAVHVRLSDLAEAITFIEPLAFGTVASRTDRMVAVVPELHRCLDQAREALGDASTFTRCAREFHTAVVGLAPNATFRVLALSLGALWSSQEETWASMVAIEGGYPDLDRQEAMIHCHLGLINLIAEGEVENVVDAATAHLREVHELVLGPFGDRVIDSVSPLAVRNLRMLANQYSLANLTSVDGDGGLASGALTDGIPERD